MNATKRKFNSLIQGMSTRSSNASNTPGAHEDINFASGDVSRIDSASSNTDMISSPTPTSALANDADLLSKRRRTNAIAASTTATTAAPTIISAQGKNVTTISNVVLRKWNSNGKDSKEGPRYCPGDRKELLKRLATFQELTDWTPKPDKVSEIEWAKRGWVCKGKERLQCTLCHKELVVKLNKKEVDGKEVSVLVPSEIEQALVDKYVELIVTSHQDDCLWRKRGCDDSLLRLSLTDANASLSALRARYDDLASRKDFLPYEFNLRLPSTLDIDTILSYLPTDFFTNPAPTSSQEQPNKVALALALTGWEGLTHPRTSRLVPNTASCHTCLRRLGLWMFKSKEVDPETNAVLVPAPMDHLDPVREHRFFCPWRSAVAQLNPGAKASALRDACPAWGVLATVLKNNAYLRSRENRSSVFRRPRAATARSEREGETPVPATPGRTRGATESGTPATIGSLAFGSEFDAEDEERDLEEAAKDKERWARLRKVKSMFSTKDGKKLKRTLSRPGTAHSSKEKDRDKGKENEVGALGEKA